MSDIVERLRISVFGDNFLIHEAADQIESLRQRVKELESEVIANERTARKLENELTALKQQCEPVAWMYPSDISDFQDGEKSATAFSICVGCPSEVSIPLYTSAPTMLTEQAPCDIPEGYVVVPKKVSMEMTIAASRKLGECDSGFWTRGGMLESVLIAKMYDEIIAAAPKQQE